MLYELGLLDSEPGVEWELLPELSHQLPSHLAAEYDALLLATSRYIVGSTLADGGDRLALVARLGAGVEAIDLEACTRADILVTSAPDAVRRPMATSAIAFMLALTLRIPQMDRATREGDWGAGTRQLGMGVTGRTLGVVGLGNIGSEVVRLATPFEMEFIAYDPYARRPGAAERTPVEMVGIDELLGRSDIVCITCPLTPETRHLIGARELALMKPTAVLVNTSRGPVVDEAALAAALREGQIFSAGIDVYEHEPEVHPALLELRNAVLAPHIASGSVATRSQMSELAARNLLAGLRGERPPNLLNPQAFGA